MNSVPSFISASIKSFEEKRCLRQVLFLEEELDGSFSSATECASLPEDTNKSQVQRNAIHRAPFAVLREMHPSFKWERSKEAERRQLPIAFIPSATVAHR